MSTSFAPAFTQAEARAAEVAVVKVAVAKATAKHAAGVPHLPKIALKKGTMVETDVTRYLKLLLMPLQKAGLVLQSPDRGLCQGVRAVFGEVEAPRRSGGRCH